MTIYINGNLQSVDDNATLSLLVEQQLSNNTKGIAVAVNQTVIAKSNWEKYTLKENDKILIIKATQGG